MAAIAGVILLLLSSVSWADTVPLLVLDEQNHELANWQRKDFEGRTRYRVVAIDGRYAVRASSSNAASALYRQQTIDLEKTPYLNWSWRVDALGPRLNPHRKQGDDFVARVYVVVRDGFFPWQTRALNYVWANHRTEQGHWPNPFTGKAIMVPVRQGQEGLGQWQQQRVNVYQDLYRYFGKTSEQIAGVAIMTDTDNAGGQAQAYYADMFFSD